MKGRTPRVSVGLCLVAVTAWGCGIGEAEEASSIQAVPVVRGNLRIVAEATGSVEPVRRVEVKSKASGEILRLHADVGDAVEPGAVLAEVDPRDVRNRYDQAAADLVVAQARADIADSQLARSEELHAAGVITDQELENAKLDQSNARANLIKAQVDEELAELQLGDVTIRAPIAGTILEKNVEEGTVIQSASQNVSGGSVLFTMAALESMQVRTLVDETDMGEIRPGMEATVTAEAFRDRTFRGSVLKIEPQAVVEQNVTMFPVIITLDNQFGLLKPGMNAEVEMLIDEAFDVLVVPNNALVTPSDVGPAMLALGLDPESMDLSQLMRPEGVGGRGPRRAGRGAGRGGASEGGAPGGLEPIAGLEVEDRRVAAPDLAELRAGAQRGEISRDSLRASRQAEARASGALNPGRGGGDFEAARALGESAEALGMPRRQTRNAVVFVIDSLGVPHPRLIQIGLNDWDVTQVVSGVEEGTALALIGAAQLQAQQDEFLNRIRGGFGSGFGGGVRVRGR